MTIDEIREEHAERTELCAQQAAEEDTYMAVIMRAVLQREAQLLKLYDEKCRELEAKAAPKNVWVIRASAPQSMEIVEVFGSWETASRYLSDRRELGFCVTSHRYEVQP